jgi:CheY-like chemotaxis protein
VDVTLDDSSGREDGIRVVLLDARSERRSLIRRILLGTGVPLADIAEVDDGATALGVVTGRGADLVVLEIQLPVREGLATIAALRHRSPQLRIVVCSFHVDTATKELAFAAGADAYLDKPVGSVELRDAIVGSRSEQRLGCAAPR